MGRRGPAPKPTKVKLAEGDPGRRAYKRITKEPVPPSNNLAPPDWLDDNARKEWDRIIAMFKTMEDSGMKVITEADLPALAICCAAYSELIFAEKLIAKKNRFMAYYNDDGKVKCMQIAPWVSIRNKARETYLKYGSEFGFTPASRTRIDMFPAVSQNPNKEIEMLGGV